MLAGNPNVGKSTLYNSLTGKSRKVGNWHGVTVDIASADFKVGKQSYTVTDLPGLYTVKGSSNEEKIAEEFLTGGGYSVVVVVMDAATLKRGIRLLSELKRYNKPVVVFVNFYSEFVKRGGKIDFDIFYSETGVRAIGGDAIDFGDVERLKELVVSANPPIVGKEIVGGSVSKFYFPPKNSTAKAPLNPVVAYPLFLIVTLCVFYAAFGKYSPTTVISKGISSLGEFLSETLKNALYGRVTPFVCGLVCDGVISGLFAVLTFLPQIAVLATSVDALDISGYLSHASVLVDGVMNKVGLGGRATYSLIGGFGCTAVAAESAKAVDDPSVEKRTLLSLPFVSCSARTPVYVLIASAAFGDYAFLATYAVYVVSFVAPALHSFLLQKLVVKTPPRPLISEIARLRVPKPEIMLNCLQNTLKSFIIKLGTVLLITSVTAYLLKSFSPRLEYLGETNLDRSILARIGEAFAVFLKPIGLDDWRYGAAICTGLFAKEGVATTLSALFSNGLVLDAARAAGLVAFAYAYTPCVTALAALKRRLGLRATVCVAVYQTIFAVVFSRCVYLIGNLFI